MGDMKTLREILKVELDDLKEKMNIIKGVPFQDLSLTQMENKLAQVTELIGDVSYSNYNMFQYKLDAKIEGKQHTMGTVINLLDEYGKQTYTLLLSLRDISTNLRFLSGRQ